MMFVVTQNTHPLLNVWQFPPSASQPPWQEYYVPSHFADEQAEA